MTADHDAHGRMGHRPMATTLARGAGAEFEYVPEDYFRAMEMGELFPRKGPLEVDLGCGDGSFLVAMALRYPERNYLGTERLMGRVRSTCRKATRAGVTNVRLLRVESAYLVRHLLPRASVSRFYVLFPDPWPKRRHWPRRLVQPEFLEAAAMALTPGGELCIKTDDAAYFAAIGKTAAGCRLFSPEPWDEEVPMTDFERHYAAQGRSIYSVCLTKC
jgi:tRNA (guanine-N7-)-methyltransferase